MVRFLLGDYGREAWDAWLDRLEGVSLLQTWAWGAAKAATGSWSVERGLLQDQGRVVGAAQVMLRRLPVVGGGLAWISRGPLYAESTVDDYCRLLKALRRHYVDERKFHLRIAPALPAMLATENSFEPAGFRPSGAPGWASSIIDLSLPTEALRLGLAQKWRNALNKAERWNVTIEAHDAGEGFSLFLSEYKAFLEERRFATSVTPELIGTLHDFHRSGRKMTAWRCTRDGTALGAALIVRYTNRAEYLAGALTKQGRVYNAGQILLWRAILAEKEAGTRWFDLGGMDPILTPKGVFEFKRGLGGVSYRLADEIEADDSGLRARLVRWGIARARSHSEAAA